MTELFQPTLPDQWKVYPPGPIIVERAEHDEDLYGGEWKGLAIWLDGGKGLSIFQCRLVMLPSPREVRGVQQRDWEVVMRDFLETPDQVSEWMQRAIKVAERLHAEMQEDGRWPREE